jgi:AcrR family transcriptional regulator
VFTYWSASVKSGAVLRNVCDTRSMTAPHTSTAGSIRSRVRAEMTEEIKATARRHLAADGANLSLRAVARDMGMVSSALYRYFPSRDDLLTALILDAYNALADAAEQADAAVDRADLRGRWLAACHAVRRWALDRPAEYALIYGSPVPGYKAPQDTTAAAIRVTGVLGRILRDGVASGRLSARSGERLPRAVRTDMRQLRGTEPFDVPEAVLARGITAWVHLFGTVSFEVFGQFNSVIDDREVFFDHQMRQVADQIGV